MRILLVYADTNGSGPLRISLGVAFLAGYLKRAGFGVDLCYYRDESDAAHCLAMLRDRDIGLVGVSSVTSSFQSARGLIRMVKEARPDVFVICGGTHVSVFPGELESTGGLDAVCLGYGEEALLELALSLKNGKADLSIANLHFKTGAGIVKNPLRPFPSELDRYFPEERELFYREFRRKGFEQALRSSSYEDFIFCRGCPFDCSFCSNHVLRTLGSGRYLNYPKVSTCIDAIKEAGRRREFSGVNFHDDILTLNKPWLLEFTREYARHIALPFKCNTRIGLFDEEIVKALKTAGCEAAIIGIESGNEAIRDRVLAKTIGGNEKVAAGFDLFHKFGIRTHSQNMIGLPGETFAAFYDTVRLNARILPNTATISVFYPYPATRLGESAAAWSLRSGKPDGTEVIERESSVLDTPDFPAKHVEFYAKNFKYLIRLESMASVHAALRPPLRLFYRLFFAQRAVFSCLRLLDRALRVLTNTALRKRHPVAAGKNANL